MEAYNFGSKKTPIPRILETLKKDKKVQIRIQEKLNFPWESCNRKLEGKGIAQEVCEIWESQGM